MGDEYPFNASLATSEKGAELLVDNCILNRARLCTTHPGRLSGNDLAGRVFVFDRSCLTRWVDKLTWHQIFQLRSVRSENRVRIYQDADGCLNKLSWTIRRGDEEFGVVAYQDASTDLPFLRDNTVTPALPSGSFVGPGGVVIVD